MKVIILSISSDIGSNLAKFFIKKRYEVYGTYNTNLPNLKIPKKNIFKMNIESFDSDEYKSWLSSIGEWDIFISCIGTLKPVGEFTQINLNHWVKSVAENSTFQIAALVNALKFRNKKQTPTVIFFAGGGTNSANDYYSAYTLGKISLIKAVELLDHEVKDTKFTILGPGWVKTKIHDQTLEAKEKAGKNFNRTLEILNSPEKFNPKEKVIEDVVKITELPKKLVGGRNFSSVHDQINFQKLEELYSIDKDFYKLRRNLNN